MNQMMKLRRSYLRGDVELPRDLFNRPLSRPVTPDQQQCFQLRNRVDLIHKKAVDLLAAGESVRHDRFEY